MVDTSILATCIAAVAMASCGIASVILSVDAYDRGLPSPMGRLLGCIGVTGFGFFVLGVRGGDGTLSVLPPLLQLAVFAATLAAFGLGGVGIVTSYIARPRPIRASRR